ncbi:MAG: DUF6118 family protein [Bryobacteraceae bacterium]|nr:DUF6118 family protein [Bryobacteraceae bacterium]
MSQDEASATEAFAQLTREVALLRRAIEGLTGGEARTEAPDYSPTLGQMAGRLEALDHQITILANSPLRTFSPSRIAAEIEAAVSGARHQARQDLVQTQRGLDEALRVLSDVVARPRDRKDQQRWMIVTGMVGVALGVGLWTGLSGPVARALPYRWQAPERMAAATLDQDRWAAGGRLMHGVNPDAWARIVEMAAFERENRAALEACRGAAARTGRGQRCRVVVGAR